MSYNPNQKQQTNDGGFAKNNETDAPAAAKKEFVPSRPVGSIKIQKVGAEGSVLLTGIWKETSKAGKTYYRGKGVEDGATYLVFLNEEE